MSRYRGLPPPEDGDEEEFEDEEEDEEDVLAPSAHGGDAPRAAISNAAGLAAALDDIAWPATTAWADTLVMRVCCFLSNTHPALLAVSQRPLAHSFVASAASAVAAAGPGSVCNIELPAAAACPAFWRLSRRAGRCFANAGHNALLFIGHISLAAHVPRALLLRETQRRMAR